MPYPPPSGAPGPGAPDEEPQKQPAPFDYNERLIGLSAESGNRPEFNARKERGRIGPLRQALTIAISLGLVAACGVIVFALFKDNLSDRDATNTAGVPTTSDSSSPSQAPSSDAASPGSGSSDVRSESSGMPGWPGTAAPDGSEGPSSPPAQSTVGPERVSEADAPRPWEFTYGEVTLKARYLDGKDYAGCKATLKAPIRKMGCHYAVRVSYKAQHANLRMTHFVYDFGSVEKAGKAAKKMEPADVTPPPEASLPGYTQGWFKVKDYGKYVVYTMVTANDQIAVDTGKEYTSYGNTDLGAEILFRM
ncbi:hypothetical protein FB381_0366 [Nocardioides albertanoniae]|uniref:Uncharacterized protein n=1 Tax=Nocardioides albertanoniae TaxID=1175486 RepID=A0A543A1Q4_9ACTN|nr:hypothetical protein [Nocardioides albertanoniae]TQL66504.1 hypothetical protein FB381_0366 [Nocardioides albertanoniae]